MRITEQLLVTPTLLRRFEYEASAEDGDGRFYALIQRDNGDWLSHNRPDSPSLDPAQLVWATQVLTLLNRELHHDGAWVVVFTHPQPPVMQSVIEMPKHWMYGRYGLIWVDRDGDPQFTQEWVAGTTSDFGKWSDVVEAGIFSTAEKCANAWGLWERTRAALELKPHETIKAAQGERPSASH